MSRAEWSSGLCSVSAIALVVLATVSTLRRQPQLSFVGPRIWPSVLCTVLATALAIVPAIVLVIVPAIVLAIVLAHVLALVLATVLAIVLASVLAIVLAPVQRNRAVSVLGNRCTVKLISFKQQGPQPSLPPTAGGSNSFIYTFK